MEELTVAFELAIQVTPQPFVFPNMSETDVREAFQVGLINQSLDGVGGIVLLEKFDGFQIVGQIVTVELIIRQVHSLVRISVLGSSVVDLDVKSEVLDPFGLGHSNGVVEEKRKEPIASELFIDEDGGYPPDIGVLIGEEQGGRWLLVGSHDEGLPEVRLH